MKAIVVMAFLLLFSRWAQAQFKFECFDRQKHHVGQMLLATQGPTHETTIQECNGGVGDPMTCSNVPRETQERLMSVTFGPPYSEALQLMVTRYLWGGLAATNDWVNFAGEGLLHSGNKIRIESDPVQGPNQFEIIVSPLSNQVRPQVAIFWCQGP